MPRAIRTAGALALALAMLVLLLPATAAAAPRWLAPADLTPPGEQASTPRVVVGPDGVTMMAWVSGGVVRVATRPAGASAWSVPTGISGPGAFGVVDLVVDPTGAAGILWMVQAAGPAGAVTLFSAVRPAGATAFGPAEQVSPSPASALGATFAGDGAGGFVAAWSEAVAPSTPATVSASTRPAGGAWSAPEVLSVPGEHALFPRAAGAGGRVAVVWTSAVFGQQRTVRLRERPAAGQPWSAERVISAADVGTSEPTVALGPAGEALAAWFASTTAGSRAEAAFRPAGGDWGGVEALGTGFGFMLPPKAVIEPDGTASVVWQTGTGAGGVVARVRAPGAGFGPSQALSRPGVPIALLPGSVTASGSAAGVIAVWVAGETPDRPGVVRAAIKPPGPVPFGPGATISSPEAGLTSPAGAVAPNGEVVAAWIDGASPIGTSGVLRVADFTERAGAVLSHPPVAVSIAGAPATAVEGTRIRFRLTVDGFADGLAVRLQRHTFGEFRDTGHSVTLDRSTGELPVRLDFPGKGVFRLAYESRGQPAFSRSVTVLVSRPTRPPIAAGARPIAIRVGFGSVWVLTADEDGTEVVMRLDPRTGRPVGAPTPVDGAVGLAVGAGAVWVSRDIVSDEGVVRLDPRTGAVAAEVEVVSSGAIGAGPAGVWTIECVRGLILIASTCGEQRLARVDTATNAIAQRVTVVPPGRESDPRAGGLAVGARRVWFSIVDNDGGRSSHRLDVASGRVTAVGATTAMVARGDVVWGYSGRSCELVRATGAGAFVPRGRVAGRPRYGCGQLRFDGRNLWVSQIADTRGHDPGTARVAARLVRLDVRTLRPIGRTIPTGFGGIAVDVGAGAVWAASVDEAVVRRIDPRAAATGRPSARQPRTPRLRPAWRRPATIAGSTSQHGIGSLDVASGGRGRAAAIWTRQPRRLGAPDIVSAIRPAGDRGWGAARRLALGGVASFSGIPTVDMNAAGEGLASWPVGGASFSESSVQVASLGPTSSAWVAPATVSETGAGGLSPQAALADDGQAVVLWSCLCDAGLGPASLRQAVRPAGGAFGAPAPLGPAGTGPMVLNNPRLAMAPGGAATVVWGPTPPSGGLLAASRAPGAPFGEPVALVPPVVIGPSRATVAVNDAGEAVAVWQQDGLVAARRAADGTWGAPERIAPAGDYGGGGPQVALDAAGNAVVVVAAFDLETYNSRILAIARRAGARAWEAPLWLSPKGPTEGRPGPDAGVPSLAMSPRGEAVVAWPQVIGGVSRVLARVRPAGRLAWRPLEAVSAREAPVQAVSVAMSAAGVATTAWIARPKGLRASQAVVRTATRPALRAADWHPPPAA